MLKVLNLTKIYKSKKGADIRALDGVTLQFPDKGMVFLLGKSGSGKSTLLNVCGGLDYPTSGEIIVKGKSSKNFSQNDFDSYRNTYIGFIFQEYNILNEFTVEDNIALALELQGKSKDKEAINALLNDVDLQGYAKRKPNTLSGGQKQRIAIARALIKSPEIIMADEPTGALDSNTGKQVLDTLKKLSRNKLVIVVSHDRDFAEQYGDRIIELKDGKVISDTSKTNLVQEPLTENINIVDDILCVKKGTDLSENDFEKIKSFLKKSENDLIIAKNETDVQNFKKISKITADGEKEVFRDTTDENIETKAYSEKDCKFIRSKLPIRHSVKIGLSSLKNKPFRLFLTILLCTVAFALFGLTSTLSFYNSESTFKKTLKDNGPTVIQTNKMYSAISRFYFNGELENEFGTAYNTKFSDNDIEELKEQFGDEVFGGVSAEMSISVRGASSEYWQNRISTFAFLSEGNSIRKNMKGTYPENANEIAISSYTAESLKNCGVYLSSGQIFEGESFEDLIGKNITIGNQNYKITAIFDSGDIPQKYDILKTNEEVAGSIISSFYTTVRDGLHMTAFVSDESMKAIAKEYSNFYHDDGSYYRSISVALNSDGDETVLPEYPNAFYYPYSDISSDVEYISSIAGKSPSENEIIVSDSFYFSLLREYINNTMIKDPTQADASHIYQILTLCDELAVGEKWEYGENDKEGVLVKLTEEEIDTKTKELISLLNRHNISPKLALRTFDSNEGILTGERREYTVIGICSGFNERQNSQIFMNNTEYVRMWDEQKGSLRHYSEVVTDYVADPDAVYEIAFLPYDASDEQTNLYWDMYSEKYFKDDGTRLYLSGSLIENIRSIDYLIEDLLKIFLYVGIGLAVFAILLFSNFISVSISYKKREIGILRAVGARSFDVFKIFFSESFFISVLCFVFSAVGCIIACNFINAELAEGIGVSLLVFGPMSFVVLLAAAFLTAVIATFLPVYNAAKKKPVDSIRAI